MAITTVIVDIETSSNDVFRSIKFTVSPNPTNGVFRVKIEGLNRANPLLPFDVFNAQGTRIQSSHIGRFDGMYNGQISLVNYPSGSYFVCFKDENIGRLVKVIKK